MSLQAHWEVACDLVVRERHKWIYVCNDKDRLRCVGLAERSDALCVTVRIEESKTAFS